MEWKTLASVVLILALSGILLGASTLTFDKFGNATIEATTISNESVTIASGDGDLANSQIITISECRNESGDTFDAVTDFNYTTAGALSDFAVDGDYYFDYSYNRNTSATTMMNGMIDATTPIGSTWMSLIVTIMMLAVIVSLTIKGFRRD